VPVELNIRNLLCKDSDGFESAIPGWAACLMELGMFVARQVPAQCKTGETLTIALCLPRAEYAALFLGCGVVLGAAVAGKKDYRDLHSQVKQLKGSSVSIIYRKSWKSKCGEGVERKTEIGALKDIENDDKNGAQVVLLTGTKGNSKLIVRLENVLSMMKTAHQINLDRRRSLRQFQQAQESHELKAALFSTFGRSVANWLVTNQQPVVSIVGVKQRILSECALEIAADRNDLVQMLDVIGLQRPESNIAHSVLESQRDPGGTCDIAVVEAGRGLVDTLQKIKAPVRFVILDRSSLVYEETADSVLTLFNTRRKDVDYKLPTLVASIQSRAFIS